MNVRDYFSEKDKLQIINAIKAAELNTSGEVRVHIEKHCKEDVLDRAAFVFKKHGMHKTRLRNGILFYLAIEDHFFAILGDAGINQKVPEGFWENIKQAMSIYFSQGDYSQGLVTGITMAGEKLKQHFPWQKDDINELPDEISFGSSEDDTK